MILDTTAIIDILRGQKDVIGKIKNLEERNETFYITTISVFEIWQGASDIKDSRKSEKIRFLMETINSLSFDIPSAKEAGLIHSLLRKEGKIIEPEDSMIAGIAKVHNEILLTRNIKHFSRISELKIESY